MKNLHYSSLTLFAAAAVFCAMSASPVSAEPLEVGADAPKVTTLDQDGNKVDLGMVLKEGTFLVYFYPKANTPGCTTQACNLRDEFEAVTKAGIQVFGVSVDTPEDQKKFKEDHDLPFTLLADTNKEVANAFGVPLNPRGMTSRQSFLIKDGKIVWRDLQAKPATQAKDAIAAAKES